MCVYHTLKQLLSGYPSFTLQLNITRIKYIKYVTRCRDSRSAKSIERRYRDDSIKQFSTQLHPTYLSTVKDM